MRVRAGKRSTIPQETVQLTIPKVVTLPTALGAMNQPILQMVSQMMAPLKVERVAFSLRLVSQKLPLLITPAINTEELELLHPVVKVVVPKTEETLTLPRPEGTCPTLQETVQLTILKAEKLPQVLPAAK